MSGTNQESYDALKAQLNKLLGLIEKNPAMAVNEPGKPPKDRNKIYHMWEFTDRTRAILLKTTPDRLVSDKDIWIDVHGRSFMTYKLIVDDPERLDVMCQSHGSGHDFSDEEKQAATDLWNLLEDQARSQDKANGRGSS